MGGEWSLISQNFCQISRVTDTVSLLVILYVRQSHFFHKAVLQFQFFARLRKSWSTDLFVFLFYLLWRPNIIEPKYHKLAFKHFEFSVLQWKKSKCLALTEKEASLAFSKVLHLPFTIFFMYIWFAQPRLPKVLNSQWQWLQSYHAPYPDPKCHYSWNFTIN